MNVLGHVIKNHDLVRVQKLVEEGKVSVEDRLVNLEDRFNRFEENLNERLRSIQKLLERVVLVSP
jgi:hypothetical protein